MSGFNGGSRTIELRTIVTILTTTPAHIPQTYILAMCPSRTIKAISNPTKPAPNSICNR